MSFNDRRLLAHVRMQGTPDPMASSYDASGPSTTDAKQHMALARLERQEKAVANLTETATDLNAPAPAAPRRPAVKKTGQTTKARIPESLKQFDRRGELSVPALPNDAPVVGPFLCGRLKRDRYTYNGTLSLLQM